MTTYRQISANRGAGFTLVEILVVIVIIGMLAGLTTTVLVTARRSVNNSIISTQEAQLSMALDQYKNKFGEYPPDLSDDQAVMRHIKKRWPRYNVTYDQFINHIKWGCKLSSGNFEFPESLDDLNGEHVWDIKSYISSLIFWLGGLPNKDGVPSGFYANPKCPLGISAVDLPLARPLRAQREKPFFSFERKYIGAYSYGAYGTNDSYYYLVDDFSQLWDESLHAWVYTPAYCQGDYPILYFRPSVNVPYLGKHLYLGTSPAATDPVSCAVPYARTVDAGNNYSWYEEKRFQLIHPGADGMFGPDENVASRAGSIPTTQPKNFIANTGEDGDNIVNFVESGTLESEYLDVAETN